MKTRAVITKEFCALAADAFDVMMEMGWGVTKEKEGWSVHSGYGQPLFIHGTGCDHPFKALVEARRFYKVKTKK